MQNDVQGNKKTNRSKDNMVYYLYYNSNFYHFFVKTKFYLLLPHHCEFKSDVKVLKFKIYVLFLTFRYIIIAYFCFVLLSSIKKNIKIFSNSKFSITSIIFIK